MSDSLGEPVHEHTAEAQENGTATHKGHRNEELVAPSYLEPGGF